MEEALGLAAGGPENVIDAGECMCVCVLVLCECL